MTRRISKRQLKNLEFHRKQFEVKIFKEDQYECNWYPEDKAKMEPHLRAFMKSLYTEPHMWTFGYIDDPVMGKLATSQREGDPLQLWGDNGGIVINTNFHPRMSKFIFAPSQYRWLGNALRYARRCQEK